MVDLRRGDDLQKSPMVTEVGGSLYFRPAGLQLLVSPADAIPAPPSDVRPEELDVAMTMHRLEQLTTLRIDRIAHSWAGLRNFVADENPVVGWDESAKGFYWIVGQGGAGIKTSPALGMLAAANILDEPITPLLAAEGVAPQSLCARRCKAT
jgi:D-arginine dehydrogenase